MIISLVNVNKHFENKVALKDISFEIPNNSIFAILGPNGAGKTTLLRIITSILSPDVGVFLYNNRLKTELNKPLIGYLPEERGLYKKMKVDEHLIYLAQLRGLSFKESKSNLDYWLTKFDVQALRNQRVEQLSKGLQQKIQFIATVIHNPEIIILDEPFSGFDPINAQLIKDEILEMKKKGKTIIISTHRMESVEELCEDIILINKGEIVLSGKKNIIKQSYSKNTITIAGIGEIDGLKSGSILKKESKGGINEYTIQLIMGKNLNELLSELIDMNFLIKLVEEKLPSMHDIFIETIKENV